MTTTATGFEYYGSFLSGLGTMRVALDWTLAAHGVKFAVAILFILGAHEMGHYFACRYYNVDCTLPFFLPFLPVLSPSGTLGAVIRIREAFPNRKALFDIGIAGPIAGFLALVPVLWFAVVSSNLVQGVSHEPGTRYFGEPLLFKALVWLKFGSVAEPYELNLHPAGFAAWFGMLATAFNLLPFGQMDGGHLAYATIGDRSRYVSLATVAGAVAMCFVSIAWIAMTLIMLAMLYFFGARHPQVIDEYDRLGPARYALVLFAVVMFVVCFTPVPLWIES